MSMMDQVLFDASTASQITSQDMTDKEVLFVQDSNGGSYSGQFVIETSSLANSGKFLAYSESYLEIPFVVSLQSSSSLTGADSLINGFMAGLKNGHHQIIDSIQIDMGNTNVVQLQPFLNYHVSYKLNTELSNSDVKKYGDVIGFALDNACTASWDLAATASGNGTSNNRLAPSNVAGTGGPPAVGPGIITATNWRTTLENNNVNNGFFERQQNKALDLQPAIAPNVTAGTGWGANPGIATTALANQVAKNYMTSSGVAGAGNVWQWVIVATIRMRDLCDFFDKIPLLRGVFLRATVNYNSVLGTITTVAAGGTAPSMLQASLTQLSGRTNPLMVASAAFGNPSNLAVVGGAAGTFSVACGIGRTTSPLSTVTPPITAVRWYVPAYMMNPLKEEQYLTMNRFKTIVYNDIYNYNVLSVASGGSFNAILTNGIINPRKVIVIPVFNNAAGNAATASLNPAQSFFDTVPASTSPLAALTNFNVQISGQNMFQQNELYDFQQFLDEHARTGINGGVFDSGIQSGLIGFKEWTHNYRYYVCDVSRRLPAENNVPKSVVISGTNGCGKILDLYCFVEFQRTLTIDLETGQIAKSSL